MREHEWLMGEPTPEEWEELLRPEPNDRHKKANRRKLTIARGTAPGVSVSNAGGSPSSRVGGR